MVESWWVSIPISVFLGFLSGLGTGGGSLLILWLGLAVGMAQNDARAINLLFFIPSAVIACLFRRKQGKLPLKQIRPAVIAGCICAAGFALLSYQLELGLLKKLFGVLLIFTGIRELRYKKREP